MVIVTYHEVIPAYFPEESVKFGRPGRRHTGEGDAQPLRPAFAKTALPSESSGGLAAVGAGKFYIADLGTRSIEHCIVKRVKADGDGIDVGLPGGDCQWKQGA